MGKKNLPQFEKKVNIESTYAPIMERFKEITEKYQSVLSYNAMSNAFYRAGIGMQNMPQIQNRRIKSISTLPADYTKEDIGEMLRNPYDSEKPLRATAEILKWTAYPFYKIVKTYQDIPTYRHYIKPLYADKEKVKTEEFMREAKLLDKLTKKLTPEIYAHKITGQAVSQGKVFYLLRTNIDKSHNKVNYAFMQQLPTDWCSIIGYNNISGYTISFNMMYFLQPGTDYKQFGNLFDDYLDDFNTTLEVRETLPSASYVYAEELSHETKIGNKIYKIHRERIKQNANGNPKIFEQNGRWCYYVTLPIDKIWTFEIDDTTAATASPLSGLMITYSQQADYEAAQISLLLNPLIKIFTGEIPYYSDNAVNAPDPIKLSDPMRVYYETLFDNLMSANNTGGTAFYYAPAQNVKSHDFSESANANDISSSFNRYAGSKAGLSGLIPVDDDIKASQVETSRMLESKFADCIYRQFSRMMNNLFEKLNLKYEWEFVMFGSIFTDDKTRENAYKAIANGDISQHYILSALDGESYLDKSSMMKVIKESKMLDMLIPPVTSYTMKQSENGGLPPQSGRPETDDISDEKEKSIDSADTIKN